MWKTKSEVRFQNFPDAFSKDKSKFPDVLCSDTDEESAEPKISKNKLWKLRPPKKCSKCIPDEYGSKGKQRTVAKTISISS